MQINTFSAKKKVTYNFQKKTNVPIPLEAYLYFPKGSSFYLNFFVSFKYLVAQSSIIFFTKIFQFSLCFIYKFTSFFPFQTIFLMKLIDHIYFFWKE